MFGGQEHQAQSTLPIRCLL